jgi:ribosomal protein L7Ae-like RNA K-turn-binding protein
MNKLSNFLGLCARAGALKTGEDACERLVKSGGAWLLLIDGGASQRAQKAMRDACQYAGVPLMALEPGSLGRAIGKPGRMAAAITQKGFADKLIQLGQIR